MRKYLKMFLLAGVFAVLLCGSALADGEGGICIDSTSNTWPAGWKAMEANGTTQVQTTTDVTADGVTRKVYIGAERVELTYNTTESEECLIFVVNDGKAPNTDNIVYIDQQTADTSGNATFKIYPKSLDSGKTYTVSVSTTSNAKADVGTFGYYAPYVLGDVNNDKAIDASDATKVLLHYVGKSTLTGSNLKAGDVNLDGAVDASDATKILLKYVGKIDSFT